MVIDTFKLIENPQSFTRYSSTQVSSMGTSACVYVFDIFVWVWYTWSDNKLVPFWYHGAAYTPMCVVLKEHHDFQAFTQLLIKLYLLSLYYVLDIVTSAKETNGEQDRHSYPCLQFRDLKIRPVSKYIKYI